LNPNESGQGGDCPGIGDEPTKKNMMQRLGYEADFVQQHKRRMSMPLRNGTALKSKDKNSDCV